MQTGLEERTAPHKFAHHAYLEMDASLRSLLAERPRILLVEDDPEMAELVATVLERNWFKCVVRRGGIQGTHAFVTDPVDLIITDLRMAAGDGVTLIEAIRRQSSSPVIIITGFAREYADRVRFLENVALINKPFDLQVLVDLVEIALNLNSSGTCEGWNIPPINDDAA
jgi:DNA-binding response OmpR family regulator